MMSVQDAVLTSDPTNPQKHAIDEELGNEPKKMKLDNAIESKNDLADSSVESVESSEKSEVANSEDSKLNVNVPAQEEPLSSAQAETSETLEASKEEVNSNGVKTETKTGETKGAAVDSLAKTETEADTGAETKEIKDTETQENIGEVKEESDNVENKDNLKKEESVDVSAGSVDTSKMTPAPKPELKFEKDLSDAMPDHQKQYMIKSLKSIKRLKDSVPFLQPVDIVALQIPFYYNFIPNPMDISTIELKLNSNAYRSPAEVADDFKLMVQNCIKFNGEKSGIARMGKNIEASFEKLLLNVPPKELAVSNGDSGDVTIGGRHKRKTSVNMGTNGVPTIRRDNNSARPKREIHPPKPKDMPYDIRPRNKKLLIDLRFAASVVKELTSKKHESYNYPFLQPVDPVALGCPTYFDYVKEPMDLSTISNKIQGNQYNSIEEFYKDVKLVFKNCYLFNPEGTPVNLMGHKLEAVFDKKWLEKPVHAPTPPPQSAQSQSKNSQMSDNEDEDFDMDEEDEINIEESIVNNQAIQFLEQQIERMKKDLEKMKKEEYEKAKKRAVKQHKRKNSKNGKKQVHKRAKSISGNGHSNGHSNGAVPAEEEEEQVELTFDMKKELSEKIADLNEKKLQHVMKIITESYPDLQKNGEDEIELDMDSLDDRTLLKLYNFVVAKSPVAKKAKMRRNGKGHKGRKASDRDKKIDILKQRLEEYDKGANFASNDSDSGSDDDDDDESESSEEE